MGSGSRVDQLTYSITVGEARQRWDLSELEPRTVRLAEFECGVERHEAGVQLVATPLRDFDDDASARAALEPLLLSWEATIELDRQIPIQFRFVGSRVRLAREEWEGEQPRYRVGRELGIVYEIAEVDASLHHLPDPAPYEEPIRLRVLRDRIREYRLGRERLLALGYYASTVFTQHFGGGRETPRHMNVEPQVLKTLAEVSSDRSSPEHERKALNKPALTPAERQWLEVAIPLLARRMGELEAGQQPPLLTMDDLPPLDSGL
jgi:hypothetical protein